MLDMVMEFWLVNVESSMIRPAWKLAAEAAAALGTGKLDMMKAAIRKVETTKRNFFILFHGDRFDAFGRAFGVGLQRHCPLSLSGNL